MTTLTGGERERIDAVKSKRTQREYEAKTKQDADTRAIRAVLARKSKTLEH